MPILKAPLADVRFQCLASVPALVSVKVSWGLKVLLAVEDARFKSQAGEVVPIPIFSAKLGEMARVSVLEVAHLELLGPQAVPPTRPEVIFKQLSAILSILNWVVEATPETVKAVVEAEGKVEAVVVVASKYAPTI